MLIYVDVLIGVTVIMLGFSLLITVINQVAANLFALRGRNLKWGLSVLIQELHGSKFQMPANSLPLFGKDLHPSAKQMVDQVLAHRLISDSKVPLGAWKLATAIRFDEFLKIVDLLGSAPETAGLAGKDLQWLRLNNRITESWFNSIMDRVSQRFGMHMRIYTIVVALIVVGVARIDTLHMVTVLRNDATIRSGLVSAAEQIRASNVVEKGEDQQKLKAVAQSVASQLPKDQSLWSLVQDDRLHPAGLLLSLVLLSLGAPFWFNALKNLAGLRSMVAKKEETERAARTTSAADVGDRITWKEAAHA